MELPIGEVIYKLRKEKGVTQETLAKSVGVSVAAVSKWESKNSYPDITILPSIARYFNTSIDNLLNYKIEISNEEVMELVKKAAQIFEKESAKKAVNTCEEYLRQYPNNMFLKFRIGSLYMMSMSSSKDEEEAKIILKKARGLLEESSKSNDKEICEVSKYSLSGLYSMNNEYDKAEEILLSLPKVTADRDDMLVSLYINQKKDEAAIKLLRNLTYKKLNNLKISLDSYISLFSQDNNYEKVKEILKLEEKLIDIFDVWSVYGISISLIYSEIYAKEKNIVKTLDYIEKLLEYYEKDYNFENHLLFDGIELNKGVHSKTYLLMSFKKIILDEKYDFLRSDKKFDDIVRKLDELS